MQFRSYKLGFIFLAVFLKCNSPMKKANKGLTHMMLKARHVIGMEEADWPRAQEGVVSMATECHVAKYTLVTKEMNM